MFGCLIVELVSGVRERGLEYTVREKGVCRPYFTAWHDEQTDCGDICGFKGTAAVAWSTAAVRVGGNTQNVNTYKITKISETRRLMVHFFKEITCASLSTFCLGSS